MSKIEGVQGSSREVAYLMWDWAGRCRTWPRRRKLAERPKTSRKGEVVSAFIFYPEAEKLLEAAAKPRAKARKAEALDTGPAKASKSFGARSG